MDHTRHRAGRSEDHSLVHIDGRGQAEASVGRGKVPNARLLAHGDLGDHPILSYGIMDLSNAYNWLWTHSWERPGPDWEPETRSFEELGWRWQRPGQPPALHGHDNPRRPQYNFRGCNVWRAPNNRVEYCWRTGVLVRGDGPYALIVDDVKKDAETHRYDWYIPVPGDLEFVPLAGEPKGRFMLVEKDEERVGDRPALGSRRLLVLPLGPGDPTVRPEQYAAPKGYKAHRMVISRDEVEGRFRVLLYPFRTTIDPEARDADELFDRHPLGAEMPMAERTPTGFRIETAERSDEWHLAPPEDGRSRLRLERAGNAWDIRLPAE
jgi:hypothetical protein